MDLAIIIITSQKIILDNILWEYNLIKENTDSKNEIFKGKINQKNIILLYNEDILEAGKYIKENYLYEKIIYLWISEILPSSELQELDIIIPNTFLKEEKEAIFVENFIWENYDLNKFRLFLNWISYSKGKNNKEEEQLGDIIDEEIYDLLSFFKEQNMLELIIPIKFLSQDKINNLNILMDLVI